MRINLACIWRLPSKILKYGVTFMNLETSRRRRAQRRRPLYTCGSSLIAIAFKASTKLQALDGSLGSLTKTTIKLLSPLYNLLVQKMLTILSFMDDHILNAESVIETIFPRSQRIFDKIDGLISIAELLPEKGFPVIKTTHRFPFLDWILVRLISWLNFLISGLTHLESKEKEITVDDRIICEAPKKNMDSQGIEKSSFPLEPVRIDGCDYSPMYASALSSPVSDDDSNRIKCTYKEILEKGKKEDVT